VILDSSAGLGPDFNDFHDSPNGRAMLLPLSANSQVSLKRHIENTLEYAKSNPSSISDLVYTLTLRRENLPHRAFAIMDEKGAAYTSSHLKAPANTPGITMTFSGQGAQWPGMGSKLLEIDVEFRNAIRSMDVLLQSTKVPPNWTLEFEVNQLFWE